jgi:hypothetical protein
MGGSLMLVHFKLFETLDKCSEYRSPEFGRYFGTVIQPLEILIGQDRQHV